MQEKEVKLLRDVQKKMHEQKIEKIKQKHILEDVKDKVEKEESMKLSIKEGATASVMYGLGESYIIPFVLAISGAFGNIVTGFVVAFSRLLDPIAQIAGSRLMETKSRKKVIVTGVALQALMWIPILILGLLFWKNLFVNYLPILLIIFYGLYAIFGAISGPSWFSLMGDLVPENIRGRYFSKRGKITGTVALLATLAGAFLLDYFKTKGLALIGFSILFLLASIFRLISAWFFAKHYEPKFKLEKGYYFSIFNFIKNIPKNNFGIFVLFEGIFYFAVMIASPFISVYMLSELNFSYVTFMFVSISASIFTLLTLPVWGKLSDKYGNREIMKLTSIFIPLVPILWMLGKSPIYLILVPQLVAGIAWGGFELASFNFIYDSVSPQRRGLCISYFSLFLGVGMFLGASLGGILTQFLTIKFINIFLFIFLISGILRAIVPLIFFSKIKEIRKVSPKRKTYEYLKEGFKEQFKPALHLIHLRPMSENAKILPHHEKRIKFKKK